MIRLNDGLDIPRGSAHGGDRGPPTDGQNEDCEIDVVVPTRRIIPAAKRGSRHTSAPLRTGRWEPAHDDDGWTSFNRKYKFTDPKTGWCTCAYAGSERPAWATFRRMLESGRDMGGQEYSGYGDWYRR